MPACVLVERERIAQQLHDTVCQELTGICLLVSAIAYQVARSDAASGQKLEEISDQVQRTGADLAALVHGLRAT